MTRDGVTISVVAPVHQQAGHIGRVLADLYAAVRSLTPNVEMLAVVNASTDESADVCRSLIPSCPGLVVLERAERGWGGAVRHGISLATGDFICFTNTARTEPDKLTRAIRLAIENPDSAVKAVRVSRDAALRRVGSVLYNLEAKVVFGLASWDVNGTPKVFPREFSDLLTLSENGDLLDLEWLVTCKNSGYPLIEFGVVSRGRHGGRSTTRLKSAFKMYGGVLQLRRRLGATTGGDGEDRA